MAAIGAPLITLTEALPAITQPLTITGPGIGVLEITRAGGSIFTSDPGIPITLTVTDLELSSDGTAGAFNGIYAHGLATLIAQDLLVHDFGGVGVFGQDNTTTMTRVEAHDNNYGLYFVSDNPGGSVTNSVVLNDVDSHDNDIDGARLLLNLGGSVSVFGGDFENHTGDKGLTIQTFGSSTVTVDGVNATGNGTGVVIDAFGSTTATISNSTAAFNDLFGYYFAPQGSGVINAIGNTALESGTGVFVDAANSGRATLTATLAHDNGTGIGVEAFDSSVVIFDGATEVWNSDFSGFNLYAQDDGQIVLDGAFIHDNAGIYGGGVTVYATESSGVNIANSRIIGNDAKNHGGGIYIERLSGVDSVFRLINSTVAGNSTGEGGSGGGIYVLGLALENPEVSLPGLEIIRSTISGNTAGENGGGVAVDDGLDVSGDSFTWISSSTISGNVAGDGGGAIWFEGSGPEESALEISHSTIANNTAVGNGDGIEYEDDGYLALDHALIANNGDEDLYIDDVDDMVMDVRYTIVRYPGENVAPLLAGPGNRTGIDPKLGPLQNNGGPTDTHFLLAGSPAIDSGDPAYVPGPTTDQRGDPRVVAVIDIGAVEVPKALAATGSVLDSSLVLGFGLLLILGGAFVVARRRRADSEA